MTEPRHMLRRFFETALASVDGRACVDRALSLEPIKGPIEIIALGKAAQAMTAGAVERLGTAVQGGLVVTKIAHLDGGRIPHRRLTTMIGGHPVPTAASLAAGEALCARLALSDHLDRLFLLSGGTSSLVEAPVDGIGLAELQRVNRWLLASGLAIGEMNLVRKALSRIKGGGLLKWLDPCRVKALAISDVPHDDPAAIGSGLLIPEPHLAEKVAAIEMPQWLYEWVEQGLRQRDVPERDGPVIKIIATLAWAKRAVADEARRQGLAVYEQQTFIDGDAAECGLKLGRALCQGPPGLYIWGGETTVRLPKRPGRGGRNQHLALAAAQAISGRVDCWLLSAGTDGSDGPTDAAGALVDGATLRRAARQGFDAEEALRQANAGALLEASGDLVRTGPTGTNVMDLVLGYRGP